MNNNHVEDIYKMVFDEEYQNDYGNPIYIFDEGDNLYLATVCKVIGNNSPGDSRCGVDVHYIFSEEELPTNEYLQKYDPRERMKLVKEDTSSTISDGVKLEHREQIMNSDFSSIAGEYLTSSGKMIYLNEQGIFGSTIKSVNNVTYYEGYYSADVHTYGGEGLLLFIYPVGTEISYQYGEEKVGVESDTSKIRIAHGNAEIMSRDQIYAKKEYVDMKDPILVMKEKVEGTVEEIIPNVYRVFNQQSLIDGIIDFNNGEIYYPGASFNWRSMTVTEWRKNYCSYYYDRRTNNTINNDCEITQQELWKKSGIQYYASELLNLTLEEYTLDDNSPPNKSNLYVIDILPYLDKLDNYMKEHYDLEDNGACEECITFMKRRFCNP